MSYAPWSHEEVQFVKTHFKEWSCQRIANHLTGRSRSAVNSLAAKLLFKKTKQWTAEELRVIRDQYPVLGQKLALPGRSASKISSAAYRMGIKKQKVL